MANKLNDLKEMNKEGFIKRGFGFIKDHKLITGAGLAAAGLGAFIATRKHDDETDLEDNFDDVDGTDEPIDDDSVSDSEETDFGDIAD